MTLATGGTVNLKKACHLGVEGATLGWAWRRFGLWAFPRFASEFVYNIFSTFCKAGFTFVSYAHFE